MQEPILEYVEEKFRFGQIEFTRSELEEIAEFVVSKHEGLALDTSLPHEVRLSAPLQKALSLNLFHASSVGVLATETGKQLFQRFKKQEITHRLKYRISEPMQKDSQDENTK